MMPITSLPLATNFMRDELDISEMDGSYQHDDSIMLYVSNSDRDFGAISLDACDGKSSNLSK
jgi:hypothetical protein